MKKGNGFTLIELILVIAILSVLAVSAIPKFLDTSTEARTRSRDGVVAAIKSGLMIYRANDLVASNTGIGQYPSELDEASNGVCSVSNPCFSALMETGVEDSRWIKVNDEEYTYDDGLGAVTYTYDPATGAFEE